MSRDPRPGQAIDGLLQEAARATPREAVVFLMHFDRRFHDASGCSPSHVQKLIVTSLLRRRALADR